MCRKMLILSLKFFFLRGWLTVPDLTVSTLTTIVKDETTPFQGGLTVPYQTPSWVTVFDSHYQPPTTVTLNVGKCILMIVK